MSILKVAKLGNPILRQIAKPVPAATIRSHEIQRLIKDMVATMREYGGVGLAAPQVHESLQITVIEGMEDAGSGTRPPTQLQVLVNPALSVVSDELEEDWEGCLSIPDLRGRVPRYREVQVRALGADGQQIEFRAAGFQARVIQHEHDHLLGKVYLDRMGSFESLTFLPEFSRYWQERSDETDEG
ncbi:MAG: peptide deformylase [Acidobacteria bacterium]|nr:peptide deformylase [Acidobacteriota bacterium]MCI0724791.1 peptide deformylase [Acidobacteriota bacterium]